MKESYVEFCPVPTEQQPINEYGQLKDSWFFGWTSLEGLGYWRKLIWLGFWGWVFASPISAASFPPQKLTILFILSSFFGSFVLLILVLLRLYLGWNYIRDRLKCEQVIYEESGWYDGQIWQKPTTVLNRDRLIVSYEIEPIIKRLKKTALILTVLMGIVSLIWQLI
jgi:hypothetical protein